jgi:hypothetical protein
MEVADIKKRVARLAPYSVEVLEHPEPREAISFVKVHSYAIGGEDVECDCLYFVSGLDVLDKSVQETGGKPVLPERGTRPAIRELMS